MLALAGATLLAGCTLMPSATAQPPVQEMSNARQAVRAAREIGSAYYTPHRFRTAERLLAQATRSLAHGDYRDARVAAVSARAHAIAARRGALSARRVQ